MRARASSRRGALLDAGGDGGMGMSRWTQYTDPGGHQARTRATRSTRRSGCSCGTGPCASCAGPCLRIRGRVELSPSARKSGFSKNSRKDSRSRSIPTLGRSGIMCATTLKPASLASSNGSGPPRPCPRLVSRDVLVNGLEADLGSCTCRASASGAGSGSSPAESRSSGPRTASCSARSFDRARDGGAGRAAQGVVQVLTNQSR